MFQFRPQPVRLAAPLAMATPARDAGPATSCLARRALSTLAPQSTAMAALAKCLEAVTAAVARPADSALTAKRCKNSAIIFFIYK